MRSVGCFILVIIAQFSTAQLVVKPIEKTTAPKKVSQQLDVTNASLPFWDDFSVTDESPDSIRVWGIDSSFQWDPSRSRGIFVNSTLAINAPTYKVATFDGLDANGDFYVRDNSAKGLTDVLASYLIDLSTFSDEDDVRLSFFWQGGGNVEVPEEGDSLLLKIYNSEMDSLTVWKAEGGEDLNEAEFQQVLQKIPQEFLTDGFRFQFEAYGDQDGPFDAWHIDWIYLNSERSSTNTIYRDRALSGDLTSPFSPFQSIPLHQLTSAYVKNQEIEASNLHDTLHTIEVAYDLVNTINQVPVVTDPDRLYLTLFPFEKDTLQLLTGSSVQQELSAFDFTPLQMFDSVVLETVISYKTNDRPLANTAIDLRVNDTIRQTYTLHDYYAFDDGTAEFAAGTNIKNGQVAMQFWVEQPDTLTHIDFHFPNISPILQSTPVLSLRVMKELTETGLLRAQQVSVRDTTRNAFIRYELDRPVVVSDTFYVGYQQFVNDYIGIGFDRSNPDASQHIFENKDGDWIQNVSLKGALMIRPVFKNGATLTLGTELIREVAVYPNPSNGVFKILGTYEKIQLLDLSGKVLFEERNQTQHDVSGFEHGLYLLRIFQKEETSTKKIILR